MICNNCGFEFEGNFCPMCGTKVQTYSDNNLYADNSKTAYNPPYAPQSQPYYNTRKPKRTSKVVTALIIVLAVVLPISAIFIVPFGFFAVGYQPKFHPRDGLQRHSGFLPRRPASHGFCRRSGGANGVSG